MLNILMIDDHPSQIEGYKAILSYNNSGIHIQTKTAYNSEAAYNIITGKTSQEFHAVFLDWRLPPYPDKKINSGRDLAMIIKQYMPQTKLVILTSHSDLFLLYNIVKELNPAGLLVKSDFSAEDMLTAFDKIMDNEIYYSETVLKSIKELWHRGPYLDDYNRRIIILLSQGIKTKNIPDHLFLSKSAVEKRKAQIKDYFSIEKGNDEDILREARRQGFI